MSDVIDVKALRMQLLKTVLTKKNISKDDIALLTTVFSKGNGRLVAMTREDIIAAYKRGEMSRERATRILAPPGTLPGDEGYDGSKTFVLPPPDQL